MCLCLRPKASEKKNLHPEEWLGGDPVKRTLIFIGCHLRFFRVASTRFFFKVAAWKKLVVILTNQKKIRWHPLNFWVDFIGYPSNHFSGCRLNGWVMIPFFDILRTILVPCQKLPDRYPSCKKIYGIVKCLLGLSLLLPS